MRRAQPTRWMLLGGRILLALIVAYILLNLGRAIQTNYHMNRSIAELKSSIAELEERIQVLAYEIAYYSSQAYQSLEVKRRLGYKAIRETVVLVPTNADPTVPGQPSQVTRPVSASPDETPVSALEEARQNAATWFHWLKR